MTRFLYHGRCGGAGVTTGLSVNELSTTRARRVWAAADNRRRSCRGDIRRWYDSMSPPILSSLPTDRKADTPAHLITPARRGAWWNGGKPPRGVFAGEPDEAVPGLLAPGGLPREEAGVPARGVARASHRAVATKPARDRSGDDHETTRSGGARFIELHDVRGVQRGDGRSADFRSGGRRGGG